MPQRKRGTHKQDVTLDGGYCSGPDTLRREEEEADTRPVTTCQRQSAHSLENADGL